jgi:hypothetical protein
MEPIPVNGIRLGPGMVWIGQFSPDVHPLTPVCQALSIQRINMVCAGLHRRKTHYYFSGCVESRYREKVARLSVDDSDITPLGSVTQVSVYPHRNRFQVPGILIKMLRSAGIPFHHLVSSPAVVSVIIDACFQDRVITLLENTFDLPCSHTPYIQEIDQNISALLKKYPETRSTYVEEKIKTYGFQLVRKKYLLYTQGFLDQLMQTMQTRMPPIASEEIFHLVSVVQVSGPIYDACFVVDADTSCNDGDGFFVDLITFHGPHFGDRYRILQTALNCLDVDRIPFFVAACAGASVSLVVPSGKGVVAQTALEKGFEAP